MRVRIKFCGMTRSADVAVAVRLGVDAIGMVFHAKSPRNVSIEQANELVASVPAFVTVTGLFMDAEAESVHQVLAGTRIDLLQFHGSESAEFCRGFGRPYIKAVPMRSSVDIGEYSRRHASALGLLLDSHAEGQQGGTGTSFDWSSIPKLDGPRLILAGGLNPKNVAAAIRQVRPYAVDVATGVESAPGIKDLAKMTAFVHEVNDVASA